MPKKTVVCLFLFFRHMKQSQQLDYFKLRMIPIFTTATWHPGLCEWHQIPKGGPDLSKGLTNKGKCILISVDWSNTIWWWVIAKLKAWKRDNNKQNRNLLGHATQMARLLLWKGKLNLSNQDTVLSYVHMLTSQNM